MVSPVSFNTNSRVSFGEKSFEELAREQGAYTRVPDAQPDEYVSGKKKGVGKKILKTVAAVVIAAAALFGLHKWKGVKWNVEAPDKFLAKVKKWAVKPGEWIDNKIVQKVGGWFKKGAKVAEEAAETAGTVA